VSPLVFMSARNLARNRRRTLLAMGAVVVGLLALTVLRGFVNSVQQAQLNTTLLGTTGMLQVHRTGYMKNVLSNPLDLAFEDSTELRENILTTAHVSSLAPRLQFSGSISVSEPMGTDLASAGEAKTTFLTANAVDPELDKKTLPQQYEWLIDGEMFPRSDALALVVHRDIAGPLGVENIQTNLNQPRELWPVLLAPDRDGSLSGEAFQISGLLGSAVPTDKRLALAPLKSVQKLLKMENQVTEYVVRLTDVVHSEAVQRELQRRLGSQFEISRWDEIVPFIKDLLSNLTNIFDIISGVFLLVVMLGIINSMFMNVLERVREIGTMMAIGVKQRAILILFVFEGVFLGALGAALGLLLGAAVVQVMALVGIPISAPGSSLKFILRPFLTFDFIAIAFSFTTVGAALVSVWPAWRASRLRPVEALAAI
jgi:putative ABC transport system permease protein